MTIDDIFTAAVNADKEQLIALLNCHEVDINELIDGGVVDGLKIKVPLLYSVIQHMHDNGGFNYEILDILIQYGIDLDLCAEIKTDSLIDLRPVLYYAIGIYESVELVEFLLSRGSYVNSEQTKIYADGHRERYSLAYCAIVYTEDSRILETVLKYGADPDRCVLSFDSNHACNQYLPLLFYSLVDQKSLEKTALLIRYGASVAIELNVGYGFRAKYKFNAYISEVYPAYNNLFRKAYNQVAAHRCHGTIVDRNHYLNAECKAYRQKKNENSRSAGDSDATNRKTEPKKADETPSDQLRIAAGALIEYDRKNAEKFKSATDGSRFQFPMGNYCLSMAMYIGMPLLFVWGIASALFGYIKSLYYHIDFAFETSTIMLLGIPLAVCFVLIVIGVRNMKENRALCREIAKERDGQIERIKSLDRELAADGDVRWWNTYDGLKESCETEGEILIWGPFARVCESPKGMRLCSTCTEEDRLTGENVEKLCSSGVYKVLRFENVDFSAEYKTAELCLWGVTDGTQVFRYEMGISEEQFEKEMDEYDRRLDQRERFRNVFDNHGMLTDEERLLYGSMGVEEFADSRMVRSYFYDRHLEKVRDKSVIQKEIEDVDIYYQYFQPVGMVLFDADGYVVAILLYKDVKDEEKYKVNDSKDVFDIECRSSRRDIVLLHEQTIKELKRYPIKNFDILAKKPENLTQQEWGALVYAATAKAKRNTVENSMNRKYKRAFKDKQHKVATNLF